jgi:hypothetical protein
LKKKISDGQEHCERYGNRKNKAIFKIQRKNNENKMAVPMLIYVNTMFAA